MVYVVDSGRVSAFTSDGKFSHGIEKQGLHTDYLDMPCGIAVDSDGNIYVSWQPLGNNRFPTFIQVYTPSGQLIYVTDATKHRVLVLSSTGVCLREITNLQSPSNVALSPCGIVYVVQRSLHKISVFSIEL